MPCKYLVIAINLLMVITSCKNGENKSHETNYQRADSLGNYLIDSIVINQGGNNENLRINITNDTKSAPFHGSVYVANEGRLLVLNVTTKLVTKSIDLFQQFRNTKADFYLDTNYTMYAIKWMHNEILEIDTNGKLNQSFIYPSIDSRRGFSTTLYPAFSSFYFNKNRDFIFYTIPTLDVKDPISLRKLFENKPIKVVTLRKDNSIFVKAEAGRFPDLYKKRDYHDYDIHYCIVDDSTVAYISKMQPEIITENVYAGTALTNRIKGLKANVSKEFIGKENDYSSTNKYEIENDSYNGFVYDTEKKRYYLFQSLGIPSTRDDGTLALYEDKPKVLYVIDGATYKVVKEIQCGVEGSYWYYKPIIWNGKLLLTRRVENKKGAPIKIDIYDIP